MIIDLRENLTYGHLAAKVYAEKITAELEKTFEQARQIQKPFTVGVIKGRASWGDIEQFQTAVWELAARLGSWHNLDRNTSMELVRFAVIDPS